MSSGSIRKLDEDCGKNKEQLQSSHNAWMSRWMSGSHSEAAQAHRSSYRADEDFEDVSYQSVGPKPIRTFTVGGSKSCEARNAKPFRSFEVGETKSCEIAKPNAGKNTGSFEREALSSSLFKNSQEIGETQALKASLYDQNLVDRGKAVESRNGFQLLSEGWHPLDRNDSSMFTTSKSLREIQEKSPSHIVRHNFDLEKRNSSNKGKAIMSPFTAQAAFLAKEEMTLFQHDHRHVQLQPGELLLRERNINLHNSSGLGQNSRANIRDYSGIRTFPGDCIASKEIERKISHNSGQKLQDCVGDVETVRFRTYLDSVEGIRGVGGPMFSQTTHRLLISEKADVDDEVFRSTRFITGFEGSNSNNFLRLSAFFGRNTVGVKLLPMNGSLHTERNQFGEVNASKVTIRNESSADTDTMDLNSLKEMNSLSGTQSTKSTKMKDINKTSLPPPTRGITCPAEAKSQQPKRQIPDINMKLPFLHASDDPKDSMCAASSSRTKSLVMGRLDKPDPMSSFDPIYRDKEDPGNRWVKRLKVSYSNHSYVQGRKNSGLSEEVTHENMSKLLLAKMLNTSKPSSEPTSTEEDRSDESSKKEKELVVGLGNNKGKELLLSHPWIKRWMRNNEPGDKEKNPERAKVLCEPQTLKFDVHQKEQFPSIGAMALMGKAMNGFQPCELKKKGSFTIWNTKSF